MHPTETPRLVAFCESHGLDRQVNWDSFRFGSDYIEYDVPLSEDELLLLKISVTVKVRGVTRLFLQPLKGDL